LIIYFYINNTVIINYQYIYISNGLKGSLNWFLLYISNGLKGSLNWFLLYISNGLKGSLNWFNIYNLFSSSMSSLVSGSVPVIVGGVEPAIS